MRDMSIYHGWSSWTLNLELSSSNYVGSVGLMEFIMKALILNKGTKQLFKLIFLKTKLNAGLQPLHERRAWMTKTNFPHFIGLRQCVLTFDEKHKISCRPIPKSLATVLEHVPLDKDLQRTLLWKSIIVIGRILFFRTPYTFFFYKKPGEGPSSKSFLILAKNCMFLVPKVSYLVS